MRSATLWKSVAGVTCALALVLGGAGVAGAAATVAPTGARTSAPWTAADSPVPDCHSAEHVGLGLLINCQNEHRA